MKRTVFLSAFVGICIFFFFLLSIGIAFAARSFAPSSASPTIFLPLVATSPAIAPALIQPNDLQYVGAFRLPDGAARPRTFEYGGNAMTFNPNGDPTGARDGFLGSLFVTGHERMAYGELPDGNQVAEITIPAPIISRDVTALNQAGFIQNFRNVAQGFYIGLAEIPRVGMAYLNHPATDAKIHLAWGQHIQPDPPDASHAWFEPNLAAPNLRGTWFIGNQSVYSVNGYLFELPNAWANQHTGGRPLGTGRYINGGWSGMGPALFAYKSWVDDRGTPASNGARLPETPLLLYAKSTETDNIERALNGYQHADEWEGGAWLTTNTGKSAVMFAGTKSNGAKYWYGFLNPAGAHLPCVYQEFVTQFTVCRLANGAPCPPSDLIECAGHTSERGWWSARMDAQIILYDPNDLARVARGEMQTWEPQPYATLDIDDQLYLNPAGIEIEMLGAGAQRRYRIGDVAFDRARGILYVLELFADDAKPVVHIWRIK
ncbi:MAG: hypothetical protein HZC40_20935 [Chloroflexi bacterium]|nr:hypothetical protein [Chloroflexota bacterium]